MAVVSLGEIVRSKFPKLEDLAGSCCWIELGAWQVVASPGGKQAVEILVKDGTLVQMQ